jgi:hypothetical protein
MGLSVDIFSSDTIGLHMAACALIAYMRPALLKSMTTPIDLQIEVPMPKKSPFSRYLAYTVILIFIHHLALFSLETFNISEIAYILTKTLVSAAASLAMITLFELVVVRFSR